MLTSTITRPVTLNPTLTCDRKIYLLETVDIGPLRRPKPRIITLEPIPKRSRNRTPSRATLPQASQSNANVEVRSTARPPCNDSHSVRSSEEVCQSPAPSEISTTGAESSSNASFRIRSGPSVPSSTIANDRSISGTPTQDKTITAAVELLHAGCLPGDTISVRISIDHTKPIVSTNGIIVTLYRQGRVDMHPALPLGPLEPGKKPQYEDYYPKSRTGLGGLSLSSAASTQGFRMDLDQSFTPLIVDPNTLTAVVKASVRIPDNVFPTIKNTPGSMISFSYFVEVIIDLRGKLTLPDRILPRLGIKGSPKIHGYMDTMTWRSVGLPDPYHSQGTNFADTDQIRREKAVVACSFEVVVGTKDSARKGNRRADETLEQVITQRYQIPSRELERQEAVEGMHDKLNQTPRGNRHDQNYDQDYDQDYNQDYNQDCHNENQGDHSYHEDSLPPHIPLPPESPEPRDEKARIRRAEVRLLPSAPPIDDEVIASSSNIPSAPPLSDLYNEYDPSRSMAQYDDYGNLHAEEASPLYSRAGPFSASTALPFLNPSLHDRSNDAIEDKQELERQRLLAEESEPPLEDGESVEHPLAHEFVPSDLGSRLRETNHSLPSAPIMVQNDGHGDVSGEGPTHPEAAESSSSAAYRERLTSEALPRYQK